MENHEEESEFDREEEHEHTNNCGHTDEEHARMKRVQGNFKKFLAENAEDMLDPGMLEKIRKLVTKRLKDGGASATFTSLKIFHEGYTLGMMTQMNVGGESARVLAAINKMIKEKEPKRTQIDITQSKPLPKEEDDGVGE